MAVVLLAVEAVAGLPLAAEAVADLRPLVVLPHLIHSLRSRTWAVERAMDQVNLPVTAVAIQVALLCHTQLAARHRREA